MIDFIKNLFSGILSFFVGLFGGKKSQGQPSIKPATAKSRKGSGFFMELDEGEEIKLADVGRAAKDAVVKTLETAKDTTAKTLETAKDTTAKTLETTKGATTKTLEKAAPAKSSKSEPVGTKPSKEEAAKTPAPAAEATKVELVQTAKGVVPVPAKEGSASTNGQKPTETTFAPKYLSPTSTNGRRRPGPNMNPFLDMARQVKSPG